MESPQFSEEGLIDWLSVLGVSLTSRVYQMIKRMKLAAVKLRGRASAWFAHEEPKPLQHNSKIYFLDLATSIPGYPRSSKALLR